MISFVFLKDLCGYHVESGLGRIKCGLGRPGSGVLPFVQVRGNAGWMAGGVDGDECRKESDSTFQARHREGGSIETLASHSSVSSRVNIDVSHCDRKHGWIKLGERVAGSHLDMLTACFQEEFC